MTLTISATPYRRDRRWFFDVAMTSSDAGIPLRTELGTYRLPRYARPSEAFLAEFVEAKRKQAEAVVADLTRQVNASDALRRLGVPAGAFKMSVE